MDLLPVVSIIHLEESQLYGTLGYMLINSKMFCVTLEPPWWDNEVNKSRIPDGQYLAKKVWSSHFSRFVFQLQNVPNRTYVEIHPGNSMADTKACILVGSEVSKLAHENRFIVNSGKTFANFMSILDQFDEILVTITSNFR